MRQSLTPTDECLGDSARKVAEITGLSRSRVYELCASGELRAVRAGGRILIDAQSVKEWYRSLPEYEAS